MKLTESEIEYLSAWAREEWEPACYGMPAHRLQLAHAVAGASLITLIKSWVKTEGKRDQDILHLGTNPVPDWPWPTSEAFQFRLAEASQIVSLREHPVAVP
jgi:hypothetical protein